jgi:hypothetical protein
LPLVGPAFFIFGLYLLWCYWGEYQTVAASTGWRVTPGTLTAVHATPYAANQFEPDVIFLKSAKLNYTYSVERDPFVGEVTLQPQGPRFYDGALGFSKSGDCTIDLQQRQKYAALQKPRTPLQAAAPFKFASLAPDHQLAVRYDPAHPSTSVPAELLQEHQHRILLWSAGSLIIGGGIMIFAMLQTASTSDVASDDKAAEDLIELMKRKD